MAHYDIFRHHLSIKFPAYGHALWEPNPGNLYPPVKIGDVGYIREGKFRRLFNVLLPATHPSHRNFGVPEHHEQLTLEIENHIDIGSLSPHNFYSAGVVLGPEPGGDRWADGPKKEGEVSFSCPMNQGAVLCLPIHAKREDTVMSTKFGKWIIKHIDRWFAWARQLELGVDRMEDIILVTGTHRTTSCGNVAFPGGQEDAQVSFRAKVDFRDDIKVVAINWQLSHNRGAVLNCGPDGEGLLEDQCVFVRGFRVTRRFRILPRLKGAAGPNPDPEGSDEDPDVELMPIVAVPEYRDPLHILQEFISEEAPDCDIVLVHDNDLAQLGGFHGGTQPRPPLESLQLDALSSYLRSTKPTVHKIPFGPDLSSADNSTSDAAEIVWVATLSNLFDEQLLPHIEGNSQFQSYENGPSFATSSAVPHSVHNTQHLLTDGYISHSFQYSRAQKYFLDLLKSDSIPPIETVSYPDREGHFFFVNLKQKSPDMYLRPLDRAVVTRGTVVPQTMRFLHHDNGEAVLQMPIFFEGVDGRLGLSLGDLAAGQCDGLRDAQQSTPLGHRSATRIRIAWPGYKDYNRSIPVRDWRKERNPITISRFAHRIGRFVDVFLKACVPDPGSTNSRSEQWQIGPSGIQRKDIIVVGAVHVSKWDWMPILQLNRYIPPPTSSIPT